MASDGMVVMLVPLHKALYFLRRYNQSAGLARHLSAGSRHTVHFKPNILLRHGNLDVTMCKHSLLIDDVVTTGATIGSRTSLLMSHSKAASVSALILLRVM